MQSCSIGRLGHVVIIAIAALTPRPRYNIEMAFRVLSMRNVGSSGRKAMRGAGLPA